MKITTYTDPFDGWDVVTVERPSGLVGIAYDPRKTASPVPWEAGCPHCVAGRQRDLTVYTKREIRTLCSRRDLAVRGLKSPARAYHLPTNVEPLTLFCWKDEAGTRAKVMCSDPSASLSYLDDRAEHRLLCTGGDKTKFQSPILHRCLKFLFSARETSLRELASALGPIARPLDYLPRGRWVPCSRIDWEAVLRGD
jgi:hypothetical protein